MVLLKVMGPGRGRAPLAGLPQELPIALDTCTTHPAPHTEAHAKTPSVSLQGPQGGVLLGGRGRGPLGDPKPVPFAGFPPKSPGRG